MAPLDTDYAFATGISTFADSYPGLKEPLPRIYVEFQPQGIDLGMSFPALLDTGGHYCILNADAAEAAEDVLMTDLGQVTLQTARGPVRGDLYLMRIEILAQVGEDLDSGVASSERHRILRGLGSVPICHRSSDQPVPLCLLPLIEEAVQSRSNLVADDDVAVLAELVLVL